MFHPAAVLAAALSFVPTAHAGEMAVSLEPMIHFLGAPTRAPDGSLWIVSTDGSILHGPPPVPGEEDDREALGWASIPPPPGCRLEQVDLGADGTVWASARCRGTDATDVVRRPSGDPGAAWVFEDVRLTGGVFDVAVAPSGDVWVAGEWRDLWRRTNGVWEAVVSPVPYHVDRVIPRGDGSVWIFQGTRSLSAVVRWVPDGMQVAYRGEEGLPPAAGGPDDPIVLTRKHDTVLLPESGGTEPAPLPGLPGFAEGTVCWRGAGTGWVARGRILERWEGGGLAWTTSLPFATTRILDLDDAGLYVLDPDRTLWRVEPVARGAADTPFTLPEFDRIETSAWSQQSVRTSGLALLRGEGHTLLYVVDVERENLLLGLHEFEARPADPVLAWRSAAAAAGIEGPIRNVDWLPAYDVGALPADLDGDGREDLVVVTMYDGIHVFRGVGDGRFVGWTRESGIPGAPLDDPVAACALDVDGDGDLDLYVANALVGDRLFRNNGAGVFHEITREAGLDTRDGSHAATCVDLDADGDVDVAVATQGRGVLLHENLGDSGAPRFETHRLLVDRSDPDGRLTLSTLGTSVVAAADLDADALPELFVGVVTGPSRFFRNRGAMRFEEEPGAFPGRGEDRILGATFADVDHDGDLDLLTTGRGPLRLWTWEDGRFLRREGPGAPLSGALLHADLDDDGDPDIVWAWKDGPLVLERNRIDDGRSVVLRVAGPPGNPEGAGARVELFEAGAPGRRIGCRFLAAGSRSGTAHGGEAHFGGIEPGTVVDVRVTLPDGTVHERGGIRAPFIGTVEAAPRGASGVFLRISRWTRRVLGDPWKGPWAGMTALGLAALVAGVFALYRRDRPAPAAWAAVGAGPVLSFALYHASPLDPGFPAAVGAAAAGTFGAGTILALVRSLMGHAASPELLAELGVSLRTFRHNETPKRISERLRFDLENLGMSDLAAGSQRASLLAADLDAYREVVVPEILGLARLARAAGIPDRPGADAVRAQNRSVADLLRTLRSAPPGSPVPRRPFDELRRSIADSAAWIEAIRWETDRRLALDLARAVRRWATTRAETSAVPVSVSVGEPGAVWVRFLPSELPRVLDVLLENAVHALAGVKEPRVEVRIEPGEPGRIALRFEDNGPGVPEPLRDAIFASGFTSGNGGEGYGLYFARRTLQRFGGSIAVLGREGAGAAFVVSLDRVPPPAAEGAA